MTTDVIQRTAGQLIEGECRAILDAERQYAGDPAGLKRWAREFFRQHVGTVAALLADVTGTDMTGFARRYCAAALFGVRVAADAGVSMEEVAANWTVEGPTNISEHLLTARG